jgi:hypothetical protein
LLAAALRWFGALLILLALLAPDLAAAIGPEPVAQPRSGLAAEYDYEGDDGACGEHEDDESEASVEELIDCGSDLDAHLDEPWAIALLRTNEVRMTAQQCQELLVDLWSQQSCSAAGRECGNLLAGTVQTTGLEIVSSSASGHVTVAAPGLDAASVRRLGRPIDERMPKLRDLLPPVPPPKLVML